MKWLSKIAFWRNGKSAQPTMQERPKPVHAVQTNPPTKAGMKRICIDPGHGMANRQSGVYDPGALGGGHQEAEIALEWAKELSAALISAGHDVVLTRRDNKTPAPLRNRAGLAKAAGCDILISIHCNAFNGSASGTETIYRGKGNEAMAERINAAVVSILGTKNRGAKLEKDSQHGSLAIMAFQPAFLIELGFIDNPSDRAKMIDDDKRFLACRELAKLLS